ncbi:MAG: CapA family protein [Bacteroidota bacterium]|nr:CapA family protein [Bacteroidota bacterium]
MTSYKGRIFFATAFISLLAMAFGSCSQRDANAKSLRPEPDRIDSFNTVSLTFAGDIMMHQPQITSAEMGGGKYDMEPVFRFISPYIERSDIAVANLETTLAGQPYSGYPQFSAPDTLAWFLKNAGFDLIVTANNHSADKGLKGITRTLDVLDRYDIPHTGTFRNRDEKNSTYPLIIEKNGLKLAFLNYTYGTNGLPVPAPAIVNPIDTTQIREDIAAAKAAKADAVIVLIHWGLEYELQPNKEQENLARFCFSRGCDLLIGSHPHVLQPARWEAYKKDTLEDQGFVVYSLGNFVSNQRKPNTDGGMLFYVTLQKNKFTNVLTVGETTFLPTWVFISNANDRKTYHILPAVKYENDTNGWIPPADKAAMLTFLNNARKHLTDTLNNITEYK